MSFFKRSFGDTVRPEGDYSRVRVLAVPDDGNLDTVKKHLSGPQDYRSARHFIASAEELEVAHSAAVTLALQDDIKITGQSSDPGLVVVRQSDLGDMRRVFDNLQFLEGSSLSEDAFVSREALMNTTGTAVNRDLYKQMHPEVSDPAQESAKAFDNVTVFKPIDSSLG